VRPQNSCARYETTLVAQIWILWLSNVENNAAVLRRGSVMSANWRNGWLTGNMGASRHSLTKLRPVNGVNACEFNVCSAEIDVFSTCFNFQTIYQVSEFQWVLCRSTLQTLPYPLTTEKSYVAVCHILNVLALSAFCASCSARKLGKLSPWYFL